MDNVQPSIEGPNELIEPHLYTPLTKPEAESLAEFFASPEGALLDDEERHSVVSLGRVLLESRKSASRPVTPTPELWREMLQPLRSPMLPRSTHVDALYTLESLIKKELNRMMAAALTGRVMLTAEAAAECFGTARLNCSQLVLHAEFLDECLQGMEEAAPAHVTRLAAGA